MDDLPKVGEKLVIVGEFGKKLLYSLHSVKTAYTTDGLKPIILGDANLQPVFKAILKRFPDTGGLSQVQGSNVFDANHKAIMETLGEAYDCLVGVTDFKDAALHVLTDCNRLVNLSAELNPEIMSLFLKLLLIYFRINMMASTFGDRKLVTAAYARAFYIANGASEPNYSRIAKYLQDFESPIEKMQEDLLGLSARVGQVVGMMRENLSRAFPPSNDSFFNEGPLNLIHVASNIAKPSDEGKRLSDIAHPVEIVEEILVGFLLCPSELSKAPNVEVFKAALQKGFSFEIFREEHINLHQEIDQVLSSFKGNIKQAKSVFSEAGGAMVAQSPSLHQERRHFLRLQLYQMLQLLTDKPGVVVPKLSLILSALSMAREEVFWYFRHFDKAAPKSSKSKFKEDDNRDLAIVELLYLITRIREAVLSQKSAVKKYYQAYLGDFYKAKLQQVLTQVQAAQKFDEKTRVYLESFQETLGSLASNPDMDLEPFRLNWIRAQVFFSLPTSSVSPAAVNPLITLMSEVVARTRYVDQFDQQVQKASNLAPLLFEKTALMAAYATSMKAVAQARFVEAFFSIATNFMDNVSPYNPREAPVIGAKATQLLEQMYSDASKRIADLLHESSLTMREIVLRGVPEQAAKNLKTRDTKEKSRQKVVGMSGELDPSVPGNESSMRPNNDMKKLHARRQLIKSLSSALCGHEEVTLYDTVFHPRQFLTEVITLRVRSFIANVAKQEVIPGTNEATVPPKRPSIALAEIESYIYGHMFLENAVDVDLASILRDIMLEHSDLESARKLTKTSQAEAQAAQNKIKAKKSGELNRALASSTETPLIFTYCKWYMEVLLPLAMTGQIVYSPLRKAFMSRAASPVKIEKYCSLPEMVALANMLGPNCLKYIEERIMRFISTNVGEIKEMIQLNSDTLVLARDNWNNEAQLAELQKKLKSIDGLYEKTIGIGVLLDFRSLFAEAVAVAMSNKTPHLFNCVANAHKQYPANTYGVSGYLAIDELANWAGILDNVDVAFRKAVEVHCQDLQVDKRNWELIGYLYGLTLPNLSNNEASSFNSSVENNENNAGCFAHAFNSLSVAVLSRVSSSSEPDLIANIQKSFLAVASTCLLRTNKEKPKELESVVLILAEFANQSKFLTLDYLDSVLPYSYVRLSYSEIFRRRGRKKGGKEEETF